MNQLQTVMIEVCKRLIRLSSVLCISLISIETALAADYFNGKVIYGKYCQGCHGSSGLGGIAGAPNFQRGQRLMKPDASLFITIDTGKNAMPAFRGVLENDEIYDAITYIRSLYR